MRYLDTDTSNWTALRVSFKIHIEYFYFTYCPYQMSVLISISVRANIRIMNRQ